MKKLAFLLSFATVAMTTMAQKVIKDSNAEKRNVSGYHAINIFGGIDLYLSQGNESVAVSAADTKYRDRIKTEVKDGVLTIWYEHSTGIKIDWDNDRKMKAYVSFKDLDKVTASGGSDVDVDGAIKVKTIALLLSGGSDFDGKVEADDLKVNASGGSDVDISGKVKNLNITASGGSDFKGYELGADLCDLNASGGSDVYITVNRELKAHASGGSDVYYKGAGTISEINSKGGSIKKASN